MKNESGNSHFYGELRQALNPDLQPNVELLYDYSDEGCRRWHNLVDSLNYLKEEQPDMLLVGEAPGYRGTSVSGVPFLSEEMIRERSKMGMRMPINNYCPSPQYNDSKGYEATSTAMWQAIDEINAPKLPMLWAVFPNHPHNPDDKLSNRKPSAKEINTYAGVIDLLIAEYSISCLVAVGNVAHKILIRHNNFDHIVKLRHPARGGARKFKNGYKEFTDEYYGKI